MKLFQVNATNYISISSVSGITLESDFAIVFTGRGAKHRITLDQARLLLTCFEVVKPIVEATLLPSNGNARKTTTSY